MACQTDPAPSSADILVCGLTGLSTPVFQTPRDWRLESRQNPQTGMSALRNHNGKRRVHPAKLCEVSPSPDCQNPLPIMKKLRLGVLGLGEGRSIISAGQNSPAWSVAQLC